jgi:hypothetical protein
VEARPRAGGGAEFRAWLPTVEVHGEEESAVVTAGSQDDADARTADAPGTGTHGATGPDGTTPSHGQGSRPEKLDG